MGILLDEMEAGVAQALAGKIRELRRHRPRSEAEAVARALIEDRWMPATRPFIPWVLGGFVLMQSTGALFLLHSDPTSPLGVFAMLGLWLLWLTGSLFCCYWATKDLYRSVQGAEIRAVADLIPLSPAETRYCEALAAVDKCRVVRGKVREELLELLATLLEDARLLKGTGYGAAVEAMESIPAALSDLNWRKAAALPTRLALVYETVERIGRDEYEWTSSGIRLASGE